MKISVPVSYADKRKEAYPPIEQQLDILYHGGIDAFRAEIEKVKKAYPKPE